MTYHVRAVTVDTEQHNAKYIDIDSLWIKSAGDGVLANTL